jgi:hypothetical protein
MCLVDVEKMPKPAPGLRHAGDGRHEGHHPDQARARCAAQRHGVPADQPPARLPHLRPRGRV